DRQRHPQARGHRVRVQVPRDAREARVKTNLCTALLRLCAPVAALAAGAQLSIQQVQATQNRWPHVRAYVNVIGASGSPIQGLSQDLFRVYESGSNDSSKILKVESLEAAQTGASIVIVVQASGAMMGIQEDIKKAVSAFVNGLGEKDQVAVVDYAESAETVSPFSDDKGDVAGKAGKITFTGKSFLLYDGLAQALSLYAAAAAPGKGGAAAALLPAAKALTVIKDYINKMYVVQWKTQLDHDGKEHKVEIAMENEGASSLKSSIMVKTPDFIDWIKIGIIVASILLVVIIAAAIYVVTRP